MIARRYRWVLCAGGDAALCAGLGALLDWPILYALAPLSVPLWAWFDGRPEGRTLLERLFGS